MEFTTLLTGKKNEMKALDVAVELNCIVERPYCEIEGVESIVAVPAGIPSSEIAYCNDS